MTMRATISAGNAESRGRSGDSAYPKPSPRQRDVRWADVWVRAFVVACGGFVVLATLTMVLFLGRTGVEGIRSAGLIPLVTGSVWKPEAGNYGALALLVGTGVSAAGAVALGAAPAVLSALWLTELAPKALKTGYRRVMEIAAAVPSVVYGWLALTYLVPAMHHVATAIYGEDAAVGGEGLASSAVLLAIMIAPTVVLLSLDALARVPDELRQASAALGASPVQTAFRVALPSSWRGILVAVFFGLARAAGETMAVQMVIGGARRLPENLFSPTTTISSQIVMDMQNARPGTVASNVLFAMALVLLVFSAFIVLATRIVSRRAPS